MDFVDLIWHLAGFVAPALFVGVGVATLSRLFWRPDRAPTLARQAALNVATGLGVLMLGLAFTGRDGRMLSYGLLVLAVAASQALQLRGSTSSKRVDKESPSELSPPG